MYRLLWHHQERGGCRHLMAGFDSHSYSACCCDKGKGKDPCVENPDVDCKFCNLLTSDQKSQLSTPSYQLRKEKQDSKKTVTPTRRVNIFSHSQSHPCGPDTCVGSGGRRCPGHS